MKIEIGHPENNETTWVIYINGTPDGPAYKYKRHAKIVATYLQEVSALELNRLLGLKLSALSDKLRELV